MTKLLIDADELLYKACAAAEYDMEMGGAHVLMSDFATAQRIFCDQEARICDALDGTEITMALTDSKNFRKDILPTYKANRKKTRKPLAYARLVEWVRDEYVTMERPGLEADDILGIFHGDYDYIVASDKDLLTIPGTLYSPFRDKIYTTTAAQANYNWFTQTLVGDQVDGYAGCPGMGPVGAQKFLDKHTSVPGEVGGSEVREVWAAIVEAFEKKGKTEEEALQQAQVARILRPLDWNEEEQKPILWC
jgi:DNA polymerase-1